MSRGGFVYATQKAEGFDAEETDQYDDRTAPHDVDRFRYE